MLRRFSIIYSTARILRNLELRPKLCILYSRPFSCPGPADSQQGNDGIFSWVKSSLHESIPSQHLPNYMNSQSPNAGENLKSRPPVSLVSQKEYCDKWYSRFMSGDLSVVNLVIRKADRDRSFFTFAQIETLLRILKYLRRNLQAHEIYCAYKNYLPYLREEHGNGEAYRQFLETILQIESSLTNYKICEEVFSEYIKFPNLKARIIMVGLRSFLENNNLQLAKEFYIQALINPDTFPMTSRELTEVLRILDRHGDYRAVLTFFNLWLKKKCTEGSNVTMYYPSHSSLSLVHRMYLRNANQTDLQEFLSQDVVQKTGYSKDVLFELDEFYHFFNCRSFTLQSETETKIQYFVAKLRFRRERREEFYLFLLNAFVLSKDFSNLKFVLFLIGKDHAIDLKPKFHLAIARYFVNAGMLQDLTEYYSDILNRSGRERLHLRVSIIDQLYHCACHAYPSLAKEIANEFKVILHKDKYFHEFPQLRMFLKKLSRIRISQNGEFGIIDMPQIDYQRFETFQRCIYQRDLAGAKSFILENLRQGIQPSFNFHYAILQKCLNLQLFSLAKTLDDLFLSIHQEVPIKLQILWLKYEILTQYDSILTHPESFAVSKIKILVSRLQDFEKRHESKLTFLNYMQLVQISLKIRGNTTAGCFLQRATFLMNKQNKRHWQSYYLTSLKLAARIYDMDSFLRLLREWVGNSGATWITHDCLRQVKSFAKFFAKRKDCIPSYNENLQLEIMEACECLVRRYTSLKFEGLEAMNVLSKFLRNWLDQEMRYKAKLLKDRRSELVAQLSDTETTGSDAKQNNHM